MATKEEPATAGQAARLLEEAAAVADEFRAAKAKHQAAMDREAKAAQHRREEAAKMETLQKQLHEKVHVLSEAGIPQVDIVQATRLPRKTVYNIGKRLNR